MKKDNLIDKAKRVLDTYKKAQEPNLEAINEPSIDWDTLIAKGLQRESVKDGDLWMEMLTQNQLLSKPEEKKEEVVIEKPEVDLTPDDDLDNFMMALGAVIPESNFNANVKRLVWGLLKKLWSKKWGPEIVDDGFKRLFEKALDSQD